MELTTTTTNKANKQKLVVICQQKTKETEKNAGVSMGCYSPLILFLHLYKFPTAGEQSWTLYKQETIPTNEGMIVPLSLRLKPR